MQGNVIVLHRVCRRQSVVDRPFLRLGRGHNQCPMHVGEMVFASLALADLLDILVFVCQVVEAFGAPVLGFALDTHQIEGEGN